MKVKVRIAPSPTGNLHIGTARTALFNWLFAKKNKGAFILRIEDTDLERSDKKYEGNIIESLKWLGLDWDGEIYRQSERLGIYGNYIKQLLDSGKAFWCHHTKEELENEQKQQAEKKEASRHICEHKKTDKGKQKGQVIRLAVDENSTKVIHFDDEVRGTIEWEERLLGDFSLARNEKTPLYNFAVVIDDIDMAISHVIRGEDHISNTPKQILIYEALRQAQGKPFEIPKFAHLPLILGPNRTKLSKRHGAMSVTEYKNDYLPEALINFLAFLGWTPPKIKISSPKKGNRFKTLQSDREIYSLGEMEKIFDLKHVHKSAAVFNIEKLNWFNSQYIKKLSAAEFKNLSGHNDIPDPSVPLITERLDKLSNVENFDYFWKEPNYDSNLLDWKDFSRDEIKSSLKEVAIIVQSSVLNNTVLNNKDDLRAALDKLGKKLDDRGLVYWPFRVALTGKEKSPDPVEVASVLHKDEVLKRINAAINKLQ